MNNPSVGLVPPETLRAEVATLYGAISSLRAMLLQAVAVVEPSSPSADCSADTPAHPDRNGMPLSRDVPLVSLS